MLRVDRCTRHGYRCRFCMRPIRKCCHLAGLASNSVRLRLSRARFQESVYLLSGSHLTVMLPYSVVWPGSMLSILLMSSSILIIRAICVSFVSCPGAFRALIVINSTSFQILPEQDE